MDDFYHRRRNENSMRRTSNPGYQNPGQDASQQSRLHQPSPLSGDPQRAIAGGRNISGNSPANYSGYYQQQPAGTYHAGPGVPSNAMGYGPPAPSYGQDTRHAHGYSEAYGPTPSDVMYGVSQTGAPTAVFDANQPFASRQPPAMQMMQEDVNSPSYFTNTAPTAAAAAAAAAASAATASSMHVPPASSGYSSAMGTTMQTSNLPSNDTANPSSSTPPVPDLAADESYISYERSLREVYRGIINGSLATAGSSLLQISEWLLSNVESLGLTTDADTDTSIFRSKMWDDFNNAWLALLEKQRQLMFGNNLQRGQSLLSLEDLKRMGSELVRLCDGLHPFGLVDYGFGVWEEQIVDGLTACVDLYDEMQNREPEAGPS